MALSGMFAMELSDARRLKSQLALFIQELADRHARPSGDSAMTLGLGLACEPDGSFGIAVRYAGRAGGIRTVVDLLSREARGDLDVRRTGTIRTLAVEPGKNAASEPERVRPLRPGISIGHGGTTAGTLGAFVTRRAGDTSLYALSNFHVLAGGMSAAPGDAIIQPGPADGGLLPDDRIGELTVVAPIQRQDWLVTDAAIARLDTNEVDLNYPEVGPITKTDRAQGHERVLKVGRTTSVTRGRVSAIELDDVIVGYEDIGAMAFNDQIEIESMSGPFSRGGDSGALVYRESDGVALGQVFAGSETGGRDGGGLTYASSISTILEVLDLELATLASIRKGSASELVQ